MNLLLHALKKAEADKHRRSALLAEPNSAANLPAPSELGLVLAEETPLTELATETLPTDTAASAYTPMAMPEVDPQTDTASSSCNQASTMFANGVSTEPLGSTPVDSTTVTRLDPMAITPTVLAASANESISQQHANNQLAHSPESPDRVLLPWLVLGGIVLLAGMLVWFIWQYQQLTQPTTTVPNEAIYSVASTSATQQHGYMPEDNTHQDLQLDTPNNQSPEIAAPLIIAGISPAKTKLPTPAVLPTVSINTQPKLTAQFIRQAPRLSTAEPLLLAWQAYQNGDLNQAEHLYRQVLLSDARQRDALLGLAAIAQQRGDAADAEALYRRLLRFNPQDEGATAALLSLNSAQMPEKDAVQLEQSGHADPTVLGHYFAAQQRWSPAQEQFFLAYTANPNQPDAALNLAVSLDHLQQIPLALRYYRQALQSKEPANFDRNGVEQRLIQLENASGTQP